MQLSITTYVINGLCAPSNPARSVHGLDIAPKAALQVRCAGWGAYSAKHARRKIVFFESALLKQCVSCERDPPESAARAKFEHLFARRKTQLLTASTPCLDRIQAGRAPDSAGSPDIFLSKRISLNQRRSFNSKSTAKGLSGFTALFCFACGAILFGSDTLDFF